MARDTEQSMLVVKLSRLLTKGLSFQLCCWYSHCNTWPSVLFESELLSLWLTSSQVLRLAELPEFPRFACQIRLFYWREISRCDRSNKPQTTGSVSCWKSAAFSCFYLLCWDFGILWVFQPTIYCLVSDVWPQIIRIHIILKLNLNKHNNSFL